MSNDAPPPDPDPHALLRAVPALLAELRQQNAELRRMVRNGRRERFGLYIVLVFVLAVSSAPARGCRASTANAVAGGR